MCNCGEHILAEINGMQRDKTQFNTVIERCLKIASARLIQDKLIRPILSQQPDERPYVGILLRILESC